MQTIMCVDQTVNFKKDDPRNMKFDEVWNKERADLMAFIYALKNIGPFETCCICVDNYEIYTGVTLWLKQWEKTKWNDGQLKNLDLWQEIAMLYRKSIQVYWKG